MAYLGMNEPTRDVLPSTTVPGIVDDARPTRLHWSRKLIALLIAIAADAPPLALVGEAFPLIFDLGVAALLWLVLGRSRLLAMALMIECIPGIGLAPTWSLYVLWEILSNKPGHGPRKTIPPAIGAVSE